MAELGCASDAASATGMMSMALLAAINDINFVPRHARHVERCVSRIIMAASVGSPTGIDPQMYGCCSPTAPSAFTTLAGSRGFMTEWPR
jgi:hypothetical protein